MARTVLKEIIIMLLLCLAIILLLGILFYEYVPMTKTIPNPVSYTTPDNVKKELADTTSIDESQVIMTYEVDATDLNNYKDIQNYKPGKANPFSSYESATGTSGTSTTTANSSTTDTGTVESGVISSSATNNSEVSNAGSSQTTDTSTSSVPNNQNSQVATEKDTTTTSGGHFFQDKGTK